MHGFALIWMNKPIKEFVISLNIQSLNIVQIVLLCWSLGWMKGEGYKDQAVASCFHVEKGAMKDILHQGPNKDATNHS